MRSRRDRAADIMLRTAHSYVKNFGRTVRVEVDLSRATGCPEHVIWLEFPTPPNDGLPAGANIRLQVNREITTHEILDMVADWLKIPQDPVGTCDEVQIWLKEREAALHRESVNPFAPVARATFTFKPDPPTRWQRLKAWVARRIIEGQAK